MLESEKVFLKTFLDRHPHFQIPKFRPDNGERIEYFFLKPNNCAFDAQTGKLISASIICIVCSKLEAKYYFVYSSDSSEIKSQGDFNCFFRCPIPWIRRRRFSSLDDLKKYLSSTKERKISYWQIIFWMLVSTGGAYFIF